MQRWFSYDAEMHHRKETVFKKESNTGRERERERERRREKTLRGQEGIIDQSLVSAGEVLRSRPSYPWSNGDSAHIMLLCASKLNEINGKAFLFRAEGPCDLGYWSQGGLKAQIASYTLLFSEPGHRLPTSPRTAFKMRCFERLAYSCPWWLRRKVKLLKTCTDVENNSTSTQTNGELPVPSFVF